MRAGKRAFAGACASLVLGSLLAIGLASANSDGKFDAARTGCGPQAGCHGVPGQASPLVTGRLDGLPEAYVPGQTYDLSVLVEGGPPVLPVAQNQGGFALEVSGGALAAADGAVQTRNSTATHTEAGNDQRSWAVLWTAPLDGTDVTFAFSVNAVNGNTVQDPGDEWTMGSATLKASAPTTAAPSNATGNATAPPPPPARTPAPGPAELGLASGLAVLSARRRALAKP